MSFVLAAALLISLWLLADRERAIHRERIQATERLDRVFRQLDQERVKANTERLAAEKERKELYQRIQAPEIAVAEAHRERVGEYVPRKPIGADDDKRFHERDQAKREATR